MKSHIRTWGIAALLGAALSLFCILPCLAAGSVGQVTLHIGQTPDTAYLTYSAPDAVHGAVTVTGPAGTAVYTAAPVWSDPAGKYLYTAEVTGLFPGCTYTYEISGACAGTFQTAADDGAFTFAFLTDPQIGSMTDARATGAMFSLLNSRDDLAFAYIAGDLTDSARSERQWELLFRSGGVHDGAGQAFLSSHLLAAAQGNHDNSSFSGHITAPSAGGDAGPAVYSFDYSNMKFVVLNLNSPDTWTAQADFLRREAAEAKANDQWLVAGFHQSLYSGAAHIVDSGIISARRFWSPLLAEAGVDVVLQGHDHVYSRGFVTGAGVNAGLPVVRNGYHAGSGAPLYMTGGESGAVKWYAARDYRVSAGDLLAPCYSFLDVNSAVPAQNPWGTDSSRTHEQTFTLIRVDGDTMTFSTYMFRYDGRSDRMITAPYLYDSLILRRGDAARADAAVTADPAPDAFPAAGYADVPSDAWYAGAVDTITARGLLDGRPGDRFAPDSCLTRGELVTALHRLAGMPAAEAGAAFSDVSRSSDCYAAVSWAAGTGLVSGMAAGRFAPDAGITRAQLAAVLHRCAALSGADLPAGSGIGTYADWRQVGTWCRDAVSWAVETGLLRGKSGNRLAPNDVVSRAEGAVFLQRLLRGRTHDRSARKKRYGAGKAPVPPAGAEPQAAEAAEGLSGLEEPFVGDGARPGAASADPQDGTGISGPHRRGAQAGPGEDTSVPLQT